MKDGDGDDSRLTAAEHVGVVHVREAHGHRHNRRRRGAKATPEGRRPPCARPRIAAARSIRGGGGWDASSSSAFSSVPSDASEPPPPACGASPPSVAPRRASPSSEGRGAQVPLAQVDERIGKQGLQLELRSSATHAVDHSSCRSTNSSLSSSLSSSSPPPSSPSACAADCSSDPAYVLSPARSPCAASATSRTTAPSPLAPPSRARPARASSAPSARRSRAAARSRAPLVGPSPVHHPVHRLAAGGDAARDRLAELAERPSPALPSHVAARAKAPRSNPQTAPMYVMVSISRRPPRAAPLAPRAGARRLRRDPAARRRRVAAGAAARAGTRGSAPK